MKKFLFIPLTLLFSLIVNYAQESKTFDYQKDMWDVMFSHCYTVDYPGTIAAFYWDGKIYSSRWKLDAINTIGQIERFNIDGDILVPDGTFIVPDITGNYNFEGFTTDGTFIYAVNESDKIFKIDPETWTLIETIQINNLGIMGIAYDEQKDGFWLSTLGGKSAIFVSTDGTPTGENLTVATGEGLMGLAYDNITYGGPWLITAHGENSSKNSAKIGRWNIETGLFEENIKNIVPLWDVVSEGHVMGNIFSYFEGENFNLIGVSQGQNMIFALLKTSITDTYSVEVNANPQEGGIVSGGGNYIPQGTIVTVTAVANQYYYFENWTENGEEVSRNEIFEFILSEDRNLTANFVEEIKYELILEQSPEDGGSVTGDGFYYENDEAIITATPNSNYEFVAWFDDTTQIAETEVHTYIMPPENKNLTAKFQGIEMEISVSANPIDGGNISGAGPYRYGEQALLTATANSYYNFINWTEEDEEISTDEIFEFIVLNNRELTANFAINIYTINVAAIPESGGIVTGGGEYPHFETVVVEATPNNAHEFLYWTADDNWVSSETTYSFIAEKNIDLVAHFDNVAIDEHNLTTNFFIYPNPAKDVLKIKRSNTDKATLEIVNSVGFIILSLDMVENEMEINISSIVSGFYLIRVTNDTGSSVKKLVVSY